MEGSFIIILKVRAGGDNRELPYGYLQKVTHSYNRTRAIRANTIVKNTAKIHNYLVTACIVKPAACRPNVKIPVVTIAM
jgi:hypothetical protein